ncbi:MAG TPA: lysophospholipid acyltransferase family protein [Rhizomicrobium sp.]
MSDVQSLRAATLLTVFFLITVAGMPWQYSAQWFRLKRRKTFPHRYHRFLCRLFGIRLTIVGKPVQDRGVLMVSNHTSYFDILALSAAANVSFVAKSQVANWPFFGLLAKLQGTVFIDRERRSQAGAARDLIRRRLQDGDALVLFPEGTSDDGNRVLAFKSALMGAAELEIDTGGGGSGAVPVQPVSVTYVGLYGIPMGREYRPLFAWYGDMDLVPHLWEAVKTGPLDVVVEFHQPLSADSAGGRKALAAVAEAIVRAGQARALAGVGTPRSAHALIPLGAANAEITEAAA